MSKKQTPKQLQIQAGKLLRGIDNSTTAIKAHQKKIDEALPALKQTLVSLSAPAEVKAAKPTKAEKTEKKAKPEKVKAVAKPPKTEKKAEKKPAKAEKKAAKPDENRPPLKTVATEILTEKKRVSRKDLYTAVAKHGYSRPSFANMLKKNGELFTVDKEGFVTLVNGKSSEDSEDVDTFVNNVTQDTATAQAI